MPRAEASVPLVGRRGELAKIAAASGMVLVTGEPGIGKTRILDEARARESGAKVQARAFAAEMVRPYGVWIDALRAAGHDLPQEPDRTRLFDAVVAMLADVALVLLDDLQWVDEGSAALLHYVARSARPAASRLRGPQRRDRRQPARLAGRSASSRARSA